MMAGRPAALLAALVSVAMAVGKDFSRKKKLNLQFLDFEVAYVRGIILDFLSYWLLSPSISFKGGLAA